MLGTSSAPPLSVDAVEDMLCSEVVSELVGVLVLVEVVRLLALEKGMVVRVLCEIGSGECMVTMFVQWSGFVLEGRGNLD